MKKDRWVLRLMALLTLCGVLTTAAFAAEAGTPGDPLVTLSYLNETFLTQVLQAVDQKILARAGEDGSNGVATPSGGGTAAFEVVRLSQGQVLTGEVGCEVLLRTGSAVCSASSEPGLVDETSGDILSGGGALAANHLYMMTIEGRGVLAADASVNLMVRGNYTIS